MRTNEELVDELHRRMKKRRRVKVRRARLISAAAFIVCLAVSMVVAIGVSQRPVDAPGAITGAVTASIFAEHTTLGYVVVALTAFCLGALVTIFCFRIKKHLKENQDDRVD